MHHQRIGIGGAIGHQAPEDINHRRDFQKVGNPESAFLPRSPLKCNCTIDHKQCRIEAIGCMQALPEHAAEAVQRCQTFEGTVVGKSEMKISKSLDNPVTFNPLDRLNVIHIGIAKIRGGCRNGKKE